MEIDKTREYPFEEAWAKGIESSNIVITSKVTWDTYKIEKFSKTKLLKFYSEVLVAWQKCTYLLPEEIFGTWYITEIKNEVIL